MKKSAVILFSLITLTSAYASSNGASMGSSNAPNQGINNTTNPQTTPNNTPSTNPNVAAPDNGGLGNGGNTKGIGTDNGGDNGPHH